MDEPVEPIVKAHEASADSVLKAALGSNPPPKAEAFKKAELLLLEFHWNPMI